MNSLPNRFLVVVVLCLGFVQKAYCDRLFWSRYEYPPRVESSNLDSTNRKIIAEASANGRPITGLDVDRENDLLYFTESVTNNIYSAPANGGISELVLDLGGNQPTGINLDVHAGKMYWSERFSNQIRVSNLDGSDATTLIENTIEIRGFDLDLINGHIYWAENGTNRIRRANLDGTSIADIVTSIPIRPVDVAIDPIHQKLYWSEMGIDTRSNIGRIYRAAIDGTNVELLFEDVYQPVAIELDIARNHIYWSGDKDIMRSDLDGSNTITFVENVSAAIHLALDIAPIPEPTTATLATLALCLITTRRRR